MPRIHLLPRFNSAYRKFVKKDKKRIEAIDEALKTFELNPKHPSLNLEKLSGSNTWTIRIDRGNRLFFFWSKNEVKAIFFFIGPHDSYKTINK